MEKTINKTLSKVAKIHTTTLVSSFNNDVVNCNSQKHHKLVLHLHCSAVQFNGVTNGCKAVSEQRLQVIVVKF